MPEQRVVLEQVAAATRLRRQGDPVLGVQPGLVAAHDAASLAGRRGLRSRAGPWSCPRRRARPARGSAGARLERHSAGRDAPRAHGGQRAASAAIRSSSFAAGSSAADPRRAPRPAPARREVGGEALVDRQRRGLSHPRNEPAKISVAPNSPSARPQRQRRPRHQPGPRRGDGHAQERARLGGPERARGLQPGCGRWLAKPAWAWRNRGRGTKASATTTPAVDSDSSTPPLHGPARDSCRAQRGQQATPAAAGGSTSGSSTSVTTSARPRNGESPGGRPPGFPPPR